MGDASDDRTLVLHGLRLKGLADVDAIVAAVDVDDGRVEAELAALVDAELAVRREGVIRGYQLTTAGRAEHAKRLAAELDASEARGVVTAAYEGFLPLNGRLLVACTRWQVRDDGAGTPVVNDHSDAAHDAAAIEELAAVHGAVAPLLADLAAALDRYRRYEPALSAALERVRAGEADYFTKPMIASYHTVWFELHEDLLATLGIERASEAPT